MPNIGSGNVSVSGSGPFTITFNGVLTGTALPQLTVASNLLSSGATVSTSVTTTGVFDSAINSGTLTLSSPAALAGGVQWNGGTLQSAAGSSANTPFALPNAITFNNSVVSVAGPSPILLSGILTLNGLNDVVQVGAPAAGNSGVVNFYGQVVGSANLTKTGAGTLLLTNTLGGASTYTGATTIAAGIVNVQSTSGLGASSSVVVANGASLQLQTPGAMTISRPLTLNGSGVSGNGALESIFGNIALTSNILLNTASMIGVDGGTLTQSGVISGPGDLTKLGGGTLALTGANIYTGQTNIGSATATGGIVTIGVSQFALGSLVGTVVVNSNSTLEAVTAFGIFQSKTLTLNGTGYVGANLAGAFVAAVNTTLQGNVILNPGSSIGVNSGFTLSLAGVVSGTGDLTKVGSGTLSLLTANTYIGNTVMDGGTLALTADGTALSSPNFIVNPGATLALDNFGIYTAPAASGNTATAGGTAAVNLGSSRTSSTQGVTLNAGTLNFIANSGTGPVGLSTNEQIGTITVGPGQSTINTGFGFANNVGAAAIAGFLPIPPAGVSAVLTANSLVRQTGGTVNFTGFDIDQGATRIAFTTAPTTVGNNGGIIPYATVNGTDFATYDGSNNTIAAFTGYVTSLAAAVAAGPGSIVKLTGQETLTGNETITGLVLAGGTASEAGYTLTVSSGGLVGTQGPSNSNTILGGKLAFGSAEGIVTSTSGAITTIDSPITGSGGLTIAGNGVVNLPTANSYTGGTTLAGGVLNMGNGAALGTGTVNLVNGFVQGLAGITIGNALTLNNSTVTIGGVNNLTFTGPVTLNDTTDGNKRRLHQHGQRRHDFRPDGVPDRRHHRRQLHLELQRFDHRRHCLGFQSGRPGGQHPGCPERAAYHERRPYRCGQPGQHQPGHPQHR